MLHGSSCGRGLHLAEAPNSTFVNDRFIALHMMIDEDEADEPSSAPATISSLLSSANPIALADKSRVGIQQRDDGGHVGAADRHDQQHAEGQREQRENTERARSVPDRDDKHDSRPRAPAENARLTMFWPR